MTKLIFHPFTTFSVPNVNHQGHLHTWVSLNKMTQHHGASVLNLIHIFLPRCWDCNQRSVAKTKLTRSKLRYTRNTVTRYYQCKKFRRTRHVTNTAYVSTVCNQARPCRLQTFFFTSIRLQAFSALLLYTSRFTSPVALCPNFHCARCSRGLCTVP